MIEPADDDAHNAYESYEVSDDPDVSVNVATEVDDGHVRRGSSSGSLDVQPLLDRIIALAGVNVPLRRDLDEKDKHVEELKAKLRATEAGAAFNTGAASRPVAAPSASSTG